jgi:hypothetical protein
MAVTWASDAERERCARLLHGAYAEGRLTLAQLEERLDTLEHAGTRADLARLTRDVPQKRLERFGTAVDRFDLAALKAHGTMAVGVNGALVGIWELTGGGAFWPAIALVPSALLLGWHGASSWTVRRIVRRRFG